MIKYLQEKNQESVYYNKEMTFCLISETTILNLETMHVIYAL